MKRSCLSRWKLMIAFALAARSLAVAQGVPADFELVGHAGVVAPWSEDQFVLISANGQGLYEVAIAGDIGAPPVEESTFTVPPADLERLWQAINQNDFFNLPSLTDSSVLDPAFARLIIRANGVTHDVAVQNVALAQLDNILAVLNEITPADADLIYEPYVPPPIIETEVCDQPGRIAPHPRAEQLPELFKNRNGDRRAPARAQKSAVAPHAGTTVACHISLEDAVRRGLVELDAKGDFWGDQVSINAKNNPPVRCNTLQVTLNIEFYGPAATPANVARIKSAIESKWTGQTTSDGRHLNMHVNTRIRPGATSPPGTPGYHQVELVGRFAISHVSGDPQVNMGVGGGKWATSGRSLDAMYGHEAGHLMDLPDRYDDYRKQADGSWRREGDGQTFTSQQLAPMLVRPGQTADQIRRYLDRRGTMRVGVPHPGHQNDYMATLDGIISKSDIDALAAQAGLIIDVPRAANLVHKKRGQQNFIITRRTGIFVPSGGSVTLEGLYAACIDLENGIPETGERFDLGPPLEAWTGYDGAQALIQLLDYIDANDFFCEDDFVGQQAIWRITDNFFIDDEATQEFLQAAGLNLGEALLEFPRMTNPDSTDTTTAVVLPPELLKVEVAPRAVLATSGQAVNLTGKFLPPNLPEVTFTGVKSWQLTAPEGSAAQMVTPSDSTAVFTTDVRGFYDPVLQVQATAAGDDTSHYLVSGAARVVVPDNRTITFEDYDYENGPFNWETSGGFLWSISEVTSYTGNLSAESGIVIGGESAILESSPFFPTPGKISFAYKVSGYPEDVYFTFAIDGVPQEVWTGKVDWTHASFDVPAGRHTLTWTFSKESFLPLGIEGAWLDDVFFPPNAVFTAVAEKQETPLQYQLLQNYPNPFNPQTEIRFDLPKPELVVLKVFDVGGHEVRTVIAKRYAAGKHRVLWDGKDSNGNLVASGVYFYQIRAGNFSQVRKMTFLR